jgi:hypothetical protein
MIEILKISIVGFMFVALGEPTFIFAPYRRLIMKLPDWLNKPLGSCYYCFTGQLSLWYFIFTKPFDIKELLFFVSACIFMTEVYSKIWYYET